jgi:hypothetical protein
MMPFKLTRAEGWIELTCDKCGHVGRWPTGAAKMSDILSEADNHECNGDEDE